ncbi:MAG: helix-turn-helix domain-containing protein [Candidatus Nanopelagicales bacterium]
MRARILLASADGDGTSEVSRRVGVSRPTVIQWRDRYAAEGLAGLEDVARSGRPAYVDEDAIVAATLSPPPDSVGVTHWSTRLLAVHLGVGDATVSPCTLCATAMPTRQSTSASTQKTFSCGRVRGRTPRLSGGSTPVLRMSPSQSP